MVDITLLSQNDPWVQIKQPIAGLPSWSALGEVLSFFGFRYEVLGIMVKLSRSTRAYVRSHHRGTLKAVLVPNLSWNQNVDLPEFLNADMIRRTERSHCPLVGGGAEEDLVVRAWNNTDNGTLTDVALNIANSFTHTYGRADYRYTAFALVVRKASYAFEPAVKRKARPYYEFRISDGWLCIVVCKWQPNRAAVVDAKYFHDNLANQTDGVYAE